MSENQQPLTEEQTAAPAEVPSAGEETSLPTAMAADKPAETDASPEEECDEEDIDPADVHIFGMPRVCFHLTAFGVAGGYILCGLLGIAGFDPPDATILAVICGAIGFFGGQRLYKKRKAARDAAAEAENNAE